MALGRIIKVISVILLKSYLLAIALYMSIENCIGMSVGGWDYRLFSRLHPANSFEAPNTVRQMHACRLTVYSICVGFMRASIQKYLHKTHDINRHIQVHVFQGTVVYYVLCA
jgi:hypothetical protein